MSVKEHYIHKKTGQKVFKYREVMTNFIPIYFYSEEIAEGSNITLDKILRIPVWVVEDSDDWNYMCPVKVFVTTIDKVDKYLGDYVHAYNEKTEHISNFQIGFDYVADKEKFAYFHDAQTALAYREEHKKRFSYSDAAQSYYEFIVQEHPKAGPQFLKNQKLQFTEFIKNKK